MRSLRNLLPLLLLCATPAAAQLLSQAELDTVREHYSLESALKDPARVYRLQLTGKKLKELPEGIRQLTNLNALDLGRNKLRELPEWLGELPHMQEFRAPRNKLRQVPAAVCKWKHLKRLDLHQNEIEGLPACMGDLKEVVSLDLWSNDLAEFPDELKGMTGVRFIDLRVIQFDEKEQQQITDLFPKAKIFFSQPCNCGSP